MIVKKCPFCDLVEFSGQGAYNLHKNRCELLLLRHEKKVREESIDHKNIDPGNGRKHAHEYRLLEQDGAEESNAIEQGYDRVCVGCGDVRKAGK